MCDVLLEGITDQIDFDENTFNILVGTVSNLMWVNIYSHIVMVMACPAYLRHQPSTKTKLRILSNIQ